MLERDQLIEIVVAVSAVFLMLGAMITIGTRYGNGTLSPEGGELLVGAIIGFILLLTAAGIGLAFYMNEPGEGVETEDEAETKNAV